MKIKIWLQIERGGGMIVQTMGWIGGSNLLLFPGESSNLFVTRVFNLCHHPDEGNLHLDCLATASPSVPDQQQQIFSESAALHHPKSNFWMNPPSTNMQFLPSQGRSEGDWKVNSEKENKLRRYPQQPQHFIFTNLSEACCEAKRWKHLS
jgi:hypothetical protein